MGLTRDENGRIEEALDEAIAALNGALLVRFPFDFEFDRDPSADIVAEVRAAMRRFAEARVKL